MLEEEILLEEANEEIVEEDRSYCVYIHTNKINGKKYVGQTHCNPPEKRWLRGYGYRHNNYFYNSIKKYGWDNFEHEIIKDNLSKKEANELEKLLIEELDTMNRNSGYNLTRGGEGIVGYNHSEESKEKMREAKLGRRLTEEQKKRLSEAFSGEKNPNYGKPCSEETKRKMSESLRKMAKNNPVSKESKKKQSDAIKPMESKVVKQYDKELNLIKIWDHILDASWSLGINSKRIYACCDGTTQTAGGYIWCYENDTPTIKLKKKIEQYSKRGVFIASYKDIEDAHLSTGVPIRSIYESCRKIRKSGGGFIWCYEGDTPTISPKGLSVSQYFKNGEFIASYVNASEANYITGVAVSSIHECCKGLRKSAGGFVWAYGNCKPIIYKNNDITQYSKNGDIIAKYTNANDAHSKTGIAISSIYECCKNIRKTAGGYIWRYADEPLNQEHLVWCNSRSGKNNSN